MNGDAILLLIFINVVQAYHDLHINKILTYIPRRNLGDVPVVSSVENPEDLPPAEPMVPGHTLIQPETGMLQSSVKFPQESASNAVYGNMDQLSITYGKTPTRILYTGFRKASSLLDSTIRQAIRNIQLHNGNKETDVIVIESRAPYEKPLLDLLQHGPEEGLVAEDENNASEIEDGSSSFESEEKTRRGRHRHNRNSSNSDESRSITTSSSESSDFDKNPGNPYTLIKGKYKQNYLWNHFMDGDHMNINPFGPKFDSPGPNGADLFFGRKWWYFNQDDFKPLR